LISAIKQAATSGAQVHRPGRQQELGKGSGVSDDAAFAKPGIYEAPERRAVKYAIRLPDYDSLLRDIEEPLSAR